MISTAARLSLPAHERAFLRCPASSTCAVRPPVPYPRTRGSRQRHRWLRSGRLGRAPSAPRRAWRSPKPVVVASSLALLGACSLHADPLVRAPCRNLLPHVPQILDTGIPRGLRSNLITGAADAQVAASGH